MFKDCLPNIQVRGKRNDRKNNSIHNNFCNIIYLLWSISNRILFSMEGSKEMSLFKPTMNQGDITFRATIISLFVVLLVIGGAILIFP